MKRILLSFITVLLMIAGAFTLRSYLDPSPERGSISDQKQEAIEASDEEYPMNSLNALQALSKQKAYPKKDIPSAGYTEAMRHYERHFLPRPEVARSDSGNWRSIGPKGRGGRTLGLAIHPDDTSEIWLGSASGGLWHSSTGGTGQDPWSYVDIGYPVLGVSSVEIDPDSTEIMYIGTGETYNYGSQGKGINNRPTRGSYGIGILRSTDGGKTWKKTLDWSYQQERGVWEIIIHPKNPDSVYAATTEGIYLSTDRGKTWKKVLDQLMVMDLAINKEEPEVLYAGVGNIQTPDKRGVYQSTDAGANWSRLSNGIPTDQTGRITLATHSTPDTNIVMALVGETLSTIGLYKSTDQGQSWSQVNDRDILSLQGFYAEGLLIHPENPDRVFAGGIDTWLSTDGGASFDQIQNVHPDIHSMATNPKDPDKLYISADGGLYRSDNAGNSVYPAHEGLVTTQFYTGATSRSDSALLMGGLQDNGTRRYTGDKDNWTHVLGGDGVYTAIRPDDDQVHYAGVQWQRLFKSTDGGANYDQVLDQSNTEAAFLSPFELSQANPDIIYAGAESIHRSDDAGDTWTQVGPDPLDNGQVVLTIGTSPTDPDELYAATAPEANGNKGHVFRSSDGGSSWTDITGSLPNRYARRITVDPNNDSILYIAYSGFGTGHLFKSVDKGNTWNDISGNLPDVPFHKVTVDPKNSDVLYAGSDIGAFISVDRGITWSDFSFGFPGQATMVFDLVVSPADRNLIAFTHGKGAFKTEMVDTVSSEPTVDFTADPTTILVGNSVDFTDQSAGFPDQWNWTFEAGTPNNSTVQNPSGIVYDSAGLYDVKLLATNSVGKDSALKKDHIEVLATHQSSGMVKAACTDDPVPGSKIVLSNANFSFTRTSDNSGGYSIDSLPSGTYSVLVSKWGYETTADTITVDANNTQFTFTLNKGYQDDFVTDRGWNVESTASTGIWELGIPNGTTFNGETSNPDKDVESDRGEKAFVTGNASGGAGDDDIDGGYTRLSTPSMDLSSYPDPTLSYHRWFYNEGGQGTPDDSLIVRVSNGNKTVTLETVTSTANTWTQKSFDLKGEIALTSNMHVEFYASDLGDGHLVEAGVDGFAIEDSAVGNCSGTKIREDQRQLHLTSYVDQRDEELVIQGELLEDRELQVRFFDQRGRVVLQEEWSPGTGQVKQRIDISNLIPNIYFLEIRDGRDSYRSKLVKRP